MGSFDVQGVVSSETGEPLVQFRIEDENGEELYGFQVAPQDAREIAQNILEGTANAIYDAALIAWAKDRDPEDGELMGIHLVDSVRRFRADRWGLPDKPEDWRPNHENGNEENQESVE
jgi:hypothetical protein